MLIKSVHSAPSESLAVRNTPQKRTRLLYNLKKNARCSAFKGARALPRGDSSDKENTPSLRDIESRHTCIIAAVFSWRETQGAVSASTSKMGRHCKVAGGAENASPSYIWHIRNIQSVRERRRRGQSPSGGVGGATRKILKGEWTRISFSGHYSGR